MLTEDSITRVALDVADVIRCTCARFGKVRHDAPRHAVRVNRPQVVGLADSYAASLLNVSMQLSAK